ncbi:hypothetical protein [Longimicrobium sp.]|uniref:hypothetical protein n=1 Tax=Longimicrobium sp. TaxID=2029185 RepID=UPI002ED9C67A
MINPAEIKPTGLDMHVAYQAVMPAAAKTVRIQDVNDASLRQIERVAKAIALAREEGREEIRQQKVLAQLMEKPR